MSIVGPSGSGKSTLLYILGALEPPSSGTVRLNGTNPFELDDRRLAAFRNRQVGFVFQDHHLLPQCTVLENVLIPTLVAPDMTALAGARERRDCSIRSAWATGCTTVRMSCPAARSSAWPWRARCAARNSCLCDEPTGNLDPSRRCGRRTPAGTAPGRSRPS